MVGRITADFIEVRQGDSFTVLLQFKSIKGFIDLTDAELKMQVRTREDNHVVLSKIGSIDNAACGKASISIIPADTQNLSLEGDYVTDIQITFGNGEVHTVYPGNISRVASFIISRNITE